MVKQIPSLREHLKQCTVQLVVPGKSLGTGFFVAPGLILTCAHVVQIAQEQNLAVEVQAWDGQSIGLGSISTFLLEKIPVKQAHPGQRSFHLYPDLALVQVAFADHPCVLLDAQVSSRDPLYIYGYPDNFPAGDEAEFIFEGMSRIDAQRFLLKFKEGEARAGFSGAPLLNLRTGGVCGIVQMTRGSDIGGRAVSTSTVLQEFPDLSLQQRVFLAYAPEDSASVESIEHLHRDLATSSIQLWSINHQQISSDLSQNEEIRVVIRSASHVLLIVSPTTAHSSSVKAQMKLAANYPRPLLLIWVKGEDVDRPRLEDWQAEMLIDARPEYYATALSTLQARLKQSEKSEPVSPQEALPPLTDPRNPYKGLHAFEAEDARDFFGREALIGKMATMLEHMLTEEKRGKQSPRLLTVLLGASGSGKSSVVKAGLLPYLQQTGVANSKEWIYLDVIRPGTGPLKALATSLAQYPSLGNIPSLRHTLASDLLDTLDLLARQLVGTSPRKVVLFIDQFEEIFTSPVTEEERQRFFDLLATAVTALRGPLLVVLTLRADFYDRLMQYRELYQLLDTHRVAVLPMEREDLRRVIKGPAQLPDVQLSFEGDLVGDLLFEVQDQSAALPLLQFTLDQLFARRNGRQLTLQAYREIGGVKGALIKHAEETYAALPSSEHQKLVEFLFVRLIDLDMMQQKMLRRRAALAEFLLPDQRRTQLLEETMDAFVQARLLIRDEVAGTKTIEVSHEALIHEWPRCTEWAQESRENLRFQQTLSTTVKQWEQAGKPGELLYHGPYLKTMKKRIDQSRLNQLEVAFLQASEVNQRQRWIKVVGLLLVPVIVLSLVISPLLVFRPSWCPSWLCPAPQVLLSKGGVHDSNLQVTFQTRQSSFKILPVAPSAYTLGTATPDDAQLIGTNQTHPYRVVLKIHSLQQGRYGLVIDQVTLIVNKEAQVVPYPLRVVENNTDTYDNNLYHITYRGQVAKTVLFSLPEQPGSSVQLVPGETDELSLEVRSTLVADLHFQVQVTYHVITEMTTHTLTLPNPFEITFSDPTNWHPYQVQAGHLVAASS